MNHERQGTRRGIYDGDIRTDPFTAIFVTSSLFTVAQKVHQGHNRIVI